MGSAIHRVLVEPLAAALVFLYTHITAGDFGLAIIILTIVVRAILHPLFYKSLKQQAKMRKIQPHIKDIQERLKHNREAQGKELLALYKEHEVNPFSGFILLLVQLPILYALYQVFLHPPTGLTYSFLGLINLTEPSIIMVAAAAYLQYIAGRVSMKGMPPNDPATQITKNMAVIAPLFILLVFYTLPSGIGLYLVTTTLFSIAQQLYINKHFGPHGTDSGNTTKTSGTRAAQ